MRLLHFPWAATVVLLFALSGLASAQVEGGLRQAEANLAAGRVASARGALSALLAGHREDGELAYRVAETFARAGFADDALAALSAAFERGYVNFSWVLEGDPDLASLRALPGFRELVLRRAETVRAGLLERAAERPREAGRLMVQAAQLEALAGSNDRAIELVRGALARGYRDFRELEQGAGFSRLRDDPRFVRVVGEAFLAAYAWTGSDQQKVAGLMTVHAEVAYNFVFFDRVPELDWDAEVSSAVPRVLAARTLAEYYRALAELVARLHDGHTGIGYPRSITAEEDRVPVAVEPVAGRLVVTAVASTPELAKAGVVRGDAIVGVDGVETRRFLEDRVLRYQGFSTRHAALAYGARDLLVGGRGSVVEVELERPDGERYVARLTRDTRLADGTRFGDAESDPFAGREVAPGIHHLELRSFAEAAVYRGFADYLGQLPLDRVRGLILDVRANSGGDAPFGWDILSHLVDRPLETAHWRTLDYRPALRAWGRATAWFEGAAPVIQPVRGPRFLGPLAVLTSPYTYSAAEDFCVPLKYAGRAVFVGQPSGGSTGQPLKVYLPGGGTLRVCVKHDTFPDGSEFVGAGIQPDIAVERTLADVRAGRDAVLMRAVDALAAGGGP